MFQDKFTSFDLTQRNTFETNLEKQTSVSFLSVFLIIDLGFDN